MAGEDSSSLSPISFIKKHYQGWKEFWCERFSFRDDNKRLIEVGAKYPFWSDSNIEAFIAIDPVHGPAIKAAREAVKMATMGSVIGAVSTAGMAWKYSKSPHDSQFGYLAKLPMKHKKVAILP
ncbi:hypothetical protein IFM89_028916 [Coptis chinensis]|uniref:Uncharacterized protein n=1 Tax=Coptis chinensis TaxID=261450 RepID=A0A835H965_9MAGN|nr:hypothetical protein IFM89_028916 [Coptis chinensis]